MDTFALLSRSTGLKKTPEGADSRAGKQERSTEAQSSKKRKLDRNTARDTPNAHFSAAEITTQEDCKKILKSHKLKVTALFSEEHSVTVSGEKSLKRRHAQDQDQAGLTSKTKPKKERRADVFPVPLTSFHQLKTRYSLPESLLRNLDAQGFKSPTEVQLGSLPLLLDSSSYSKPSNLSSQTLPACDLMTIAPTGSGKTLAFLIPMVASILRKRKLEQSKPSTGPLGIIIAPTKELARQIVNECRKLCAKTGVRTTLVRRGVSVYGAHADEDLALDESLPESDDETSGTTRTTFRLKSHILVATPKAMVNAARPYGSDSARLPTVENLVLDEADVLLDPLFREQTMEIWDACTHADLRTGLWSATVGSSIEELAISTLKARHSKQSQQGGLHLLRLVVGLKDSSIPGIDHRLVYAASEQGKLMGMRQLLHSPESSTSGVILRPPFLVFTQTIPRATALHSELLYDIPVEAGGSSRVAVLHSDLSETARGKVMERLRKGEIWVLITTDLLARGIDFRGINGVVNYDLPTSSAAYVHRAGRTGRAGKKGGVAITLYSKDDLPFVKNIANVIAASQRVTGGEEPADAERKWLLESLPKVTKKDKQRLKQRGVESRRSRPMEADQNGSKHSSTQISTKGGFLRQLENRKKGAIQGSKRRKLGATTNSSEGESDGLGTFE